MKRNLDLIKAIMIALEERDNHSYSAPLYLAGFNNDEVNYHLSLLMDANYITGHITKYDVIFPKRLTNSGHDFLDVSRNDNVWNKTKNVVKEKGLSVTLDIFKELLVSVTKQSLGLQ